MYKWFAKIKGEQLGKPWNVSYETYRLVFEKFFGKVVDKLIYSGKSLNLTKKLGKIRIRKVDKVYRIEKTTGKILNGNINWGATWKMWNEQDAKGEERSDKIFYMDTYYLRWAWIKRGGNCTVKNNTMYKFSPTNNSSNNTRLGTKGRMSKANKEDKTLHQKYEYIKKDNVAKIVTVDNFKKKK